MPQENTQEAINKEAKYLSELETKALNGDAQAQKQFADEINSIGNKNNEYFEALSKALHELNPNDKTTLSRDARGNEFLSLSDAFPKQAWETKPAVVKTVEELSTNHGGIATDIHNKRGDRVVTFLDGTQLTVDSDLNHRMTIKLNHGGVANLDKNGNVETLVIAPGDGSKGTVNCSYDKNGNLDRVTIDYGAQGQFTYKHNSDGTWTYIDKDGNERKFNKGPTVSAEGLVLPTGAVLQTNGEVVRGPRGTQVGDK